MSDIFKKLNLANQTEILVVNAPESFEAETAPLEGITVRRKIAEVDQVGFSLAFVTKQAEVDSLSKAIAKKAVGDAVVWFAYPKGTSKKYKCDFNRDTGWAALGKLGFEAVRQVAIDEDWSALRFRRVEFIQSMVREAKRAMTRQGKNRLTKK